MEISIFHFNCKPVPYLKNGMEGEKKEAEARLVIFKSSSRSKIQLSLIYIRNHDEIRNCYGSLASVAQWLE